VNKETQETLANILSSRLTFKYLSLFFFYSFILDFHNFHGVMSTALRAYGLTASAIGVFSRARLEFALGDDK
jgi:hypothetical protein